VVIIGLSVWAIINREWLRGLAEYGYLGIFVISVVSTAAMFIPGPGIVIPLAMGSILDPVLVGMACGLGEGVGALASYSLGEQGKSLFTGHSDIIKGHESRYYTIYRKIDKWMMYHGGLTLFISSVLINPFFAPIGIAAAAVRYPRWKYFLICWAGRTVKSIILAYLGAFGISALLNLIGWST